MDGAIERSGAAYREGMTLSDYLDRLDADTIDRCLPPSPTAQLLRLLDAPPLPVADIVEYARTVPTIARHRPATPSSRYPVVGWISSPIIDWSPVAADGDARGTTLEIIDQPDEPPSLGDGKPNIGVPVWPERTDIDAIRRAGFPADRDFRREYEVDWSGEDRPAPQPDAPPPVRRPLPGSPADVRERPPVGNRPTRPQ